MHFPAFSKSVSRTMAFSGYRQDDFSQQKYRAELEDLVKDAHSQNLIRTETLAKTEGMLQDYESVRSRSTVDDLHVANCRSLVSESVRHKVYGGNQAAGQVVDGELDRLKVIIVKHLQEGLGALSEEHQGGSLKYNAAIGASTDGSGPGPVCLETSLTGELTARKEEAICKGGDDLHLASCSSLVSESVRHKVYGGNQAAGQVVDGELDRLKVIIVKHLQEGLGALSEGHQGGSLRLNATITASTDGSDQGPVCLKISLTGELTARKEETICKGGEETPRRSVGSHHKHISMSMPNHNLASLRIVPSSLKSQSPRNRYAPTNQDPMWGYRHNVDLNKKGALSDYRVGEHVPTLRASTLVRPGTNADWRIRIVNVGAKRASRFGVVSNNFVWKEDWYDASKFGLAWYLTRDGFYKGSTLCTDHRTRLKANDILGIHLSWMSDNSGCLLFSVNGNHLGKMSGIQGPLHLACQLLNKYDSVVFMEEQIDKISRSPRNDVFSRSPISRSPTRNRYSPTSDDEDRGGIGFFFVSNPQQDSVLVDQSLELWIPTVVDSEVDVCLDGKEIRSSVGEDVCLEGKEIRSCVAPAVPSSLSQSPSPSREISEGVPPMVATLMRDVSKLQAELRLVVSERDNFREKLQRMLILDTEKNRNLQRLETDLLTLQSQVEMHSSQNVALSRDVVQQMVIRESIIKELVRNSKNQDQLVIRESIIKELDNTRKHFIDRDRHTTTLEKRLRDAEAVLGSFQDPDFGGAKWQEFCVSSGKSGGFHDKTTCRQVAPHTQNFSPHTRDLIWKRALSARGERTTSSVKGAWVHTRSSPVLTEAMFDMRPRTRPLSASSARATFSPFEAEKRTGQPSKTPEEKKIFRAAGRLLSTSRSGSNLWICRPKNSPPAGSSDRGGPKESLMAAAACDNLEVVLKMLSLVEDLSRKSVLVSQTLAHAAKHGSHGVCEGIVEMWPKHNLSAALFCSAQVGEVGIMDLLIEKGADVHVRDADGSTPLILAAFHGQVAAVQRLLQAGCDIHASDNDGYTALMWASYKGRNEAASMLLQSGADSNATSREGNTTLAYAAYSGSLSLVSVLLSYSKDPHRRNALGMSAADVAEQQGHREIAVLLRQDEARSTAS